MLYDIFPCATQFKQSSYTNYSNVNVTFASISAFYTYYRICYMSNMDHNTDKNTLLLGIILCNSIDVNETVNDILPLPYKVLPYCHLLLQPLYKSQNFLFNVLIVGITSQNNFIDEFVTICDICIFLASDDIIS